MGHQANSDTTLSLLRKLGVSPRNEAAWGDFVDRYGTNILAWCRYWGLQDADAADVTQAVLMKIATNLEKFDAAAGSFRAWLRTVSQNAWRDLVKSRQYKVVKGGDKLRRRLESAEARDDLAQHLERAWEEELMQLASDRVRPRVHPRTWRAFELTALEDVPGKQVASDLGMTLANVYKAKSNVVKMLQAEVSDLELGQFT